MRATTARLLLPRARSASSKSLLPGPRGVRKLFRLHDCRAPRATGPAASQSRRRQPPIASSLSSGDHSGNRKPQAQRKWITSLQSHLAIPFWPRSRANSLVTAIPLQDPVSPTCARRDPRGPRCRRCRHRVPCHGYSHFEGRYLLSRELVTGKELAGVRRGQRRRWTATPVSGVIDSRGDRPH